MSFLHKTKYIDKIKKEDYIFRCEKMKSFLRMKMSFGKKRKQRIFSHSIFERDHLFDREKNALPQPYYFEPTDIIIYDLVAKKDLKQTKSGLIRLFKRCFTHKYITGGKSEENIEKLINGLDQTLHSGNSWYNIGLFDFAYDKELDKYIHHFVIRFHNFSSSYAAVEIRIALSNSIKNEIREFINNDYNKPGMRIHKHWIKNKKKSGAVIGYGVSSGEASEYAKYIIISEQLDYIKNTFMSQIVRYFPLIQYSTSQDLTGIIVCETNITPYDEFDYSIYNAIGINDRYGFNLSIGERLYTSTGEDWFSQDGKSNMMLLYNPDQIDDYKIYVNQHNYVLEHFTSDIMSELYKTFVVRNLGYLYLGLISDYRNRINACKYDKKSHSKLLKLKYEYNKDFYDFKKITDELPVCNELESANQYIEKNDYSRTSVYLGRFHPYKLFTESPKWMWNQVKENYTEIEMDLERKIDIASGMMTYSRENSNKRLAIYQLVFAAMTFTLLIFPELAQRLADKIKIIWSYIENMF